MPGERMIGLEALKDQLRLLGHGDLPDDQIVAILRDMNIDFATGAWHCKHCLTSCFIVIRHMHNRRFTTADSCIRPC